MANVVAKGTMPGHARTRHFRRELQHPAKGSNHHKFQPHKFHPPHKFQPAHELMTKLEMTMRHQEEGRKG
ncbi:unnamed protein product, partial [Linum tenue]